MCLVLLSRQTGANHLNLKQKILYTDRFFRVSQYECRVYAMTHFSRKLPRAIAATGARSGT